MDLTVNLPQLIGIFRGLVSVKIRVSFVVDKNMSFLAQQCPKILELDISESKVQTLGFLKSFKKLKNLRISKSRSISDLAEFKRLEDVSAQLRKLDLSGNLFITPSGNEYFSEIFQTFMDSKLEYLNLEGFNVPTDATANSIKECGNTLKELYLAGTSITSVGVLKILESLTDLTHLQLGEGQITNETLSKLQKCAYLKYLHMKDMGKAWGSLETSESGVKQALENLSIPSLKVLKLSFCPILTDLLLEVILVNNPQIRCLSLESCSQLTDNIWDVIGRLPCLEKLKLIAMHDLTYAASSAFRQSHPTLKVTVWGALS